MGDNGRKLPRTCGVVVPVKIIGTGKIVIFGSFHFKSGKDEVKDRGQRYYDCYAFLEKVKDVKKTLRSIGELKEKDCPTFLFGDANADGNTKTLDNKYEEKKVTLTVPFQGESYMESYIRKIGDCVIKDAQLLESETTTVTLATEAYRNIKTVEADSAFGLAKAYKYADLLAQLSQRVITSWKFRMEGVQKDKRQVLHKVYGDPCWYNNEWATPCEVTMPWLETQLLQHNRDLDNDNFCMIRPEHPSDHCSIAQTFLIHETKNTNPSKRIDDREMQDMMLPSAWKSHNAKLRMKPETLRLLKNSRKLSRSQSV